MQKWGRGKEDNSCFLAMIHRMQCPAGAVYGNCQRKMNFIRNVRNIIGNIRCSLYAFFWPLNITETFLRAWLCFYFFPHHCSSSWQPTLWHLAASRAPGPSRIPLRRRPCTVPCMKADSWPLPDTSWAPPQPWESMGTPTQVVKAMGIMLPMEQTPLLSTLWWVKNIGYISV